MIQFRESKAQEGDEGASGRWEWEGEAKASLLLCLCRAQLDLQLLPAIVQPARQYFWFIDIVVQLGRQINHRAAYQGLAGSSYAGSIIGEKSSPLNFLRLLGQ